MPLDTRDGGRAAKMRAGLPTRADNRAGIAPGRDRAFRVDLRVGSTPSGELKHKGRLWCWHQALSAAFARLASLLASALG